MNNDYMTLNKYARHRGISTTAVRKAIREGRITAKKKKRGRGYEYMIDPDVVDRQWAENTDESKPLNSVSRDPQHRTNPDNPKVPIGDQQIGASYAKARAAREGYQARLVKLEYEEKSGKLVNADEVKVANFNAARIARDTLMNIPDRLAPVLAGKNDSNEIHKLLSEEIKRTLEELCNSLQRMFAQKV